MSTMEPIRDIEAVEDISKTLSRLRTRRGRRLYLFWKVGTMTGLRVGDMIRLKVGDLRGRKNYTYLPQKQSHKMRAREITIPIQAQLRKVIEARTEGMADGDWLFPSRTPTAGGNPAHITRQQAYLDMQEIQRICKVRQRIGCHTMRKTFGYHYYQRTHDLASLQTWFYHENPSTTLIYCGISYDNLARMVDRSPFRLAEGELVDPDGDVQNV